METLEKDGVVMATGALVRPRDPAEDRFSRMLMGITPSTADLTKPVSLVRPIGDPRPPVGNQGRQGACAAVSSGLAVETAHNYVRLTNGDPVNARSINGGPIYYEARKMHGWFPQDFGSYIADDLDLLLNRTPLVSDGAYSDDPKKDWSGFPWHTDVDYELQHQPFYPGDGNTLEHIWNAINAGCPIEQGGYWANAFYSPVKGKLPANITEFMQSGHAYYLWAVVPGFVLASNQWSSFWNPDAADFGFNMRPGDFAIPWEYYTRAATPWWEWRVVSPEPVPVDPHSPGFVEFYGTVFKAKANKITVEPNDRLTTNLAGRQIRATSGEAVFNGRIKGFDEKWIVIKPTTFSELWDLRGQPIHIETID